ncbi:hypothetical protein L3X38_017391 [Prunus dulcis]|uniref:At2g29880-like C-terminal domain-containing protein n=1 Tax=Prunus dulcis TaxID=3755 RepID=A0AAD4W720_PRUDU|nr:hypothetical protein L3X38_017391 [Prunus dulcis]
MVDAANYGWHDSNDLPSKQIVESKILHWDSISKKFTATEEVWQDYFKSHPSQVHLQRKTFADYEDLVIAIGNGTATGKNSIGLGDDTDARTYQVGESRPTRLQDTNEAFVPSQNETPYQTLSSGPSLDAIKETPNLDNRARYKALGLVHKLGIKNVFLRMLLEEHLEWILYNME